MATRDEILSYAGEYLELESYRDYGPMGLQVVGSADVEKIACGVSASRELLERATDAGAQMVLVHHGLFWDRDPRVIDPVMRGRLKALFDFSLVAYHLALMAGDGALSARFWERAGRGIYERRPCLNVRVVVSNYALLGTMR